MLRAVSSVGLEREESGCAPRMSSAVAGRSPYAIDLSGDLMGIVDNEGRLQAIDSYLSCINCLLENSLVSRPWLGVNYISLSDLIPSDAGEKLAGAQVAKNAAGIAFEKLSPAAKAGLKEGDIIVAVNGTAVSENNDLNSLIGAYRANDEIELEYLRGGIRTKVKITLGELME